MWPVAIEDMTSHIYYNGGTISSNYNDFDKIVQSCQTIIFYCIVALM